MSIGPRRDARAGMSFGRKAGLGLALAGALVLLAPSVAGAQDAEPTETAILGQQVNLLWIVIGAVLVIFMQAGFALVETGFCRAKHAAHVVSTNFAVFGLGFVGYFLFGYAFMFGGYSYPLPGYDFGYNLPVGDALIGSGNWVFLWQGGFALSGDPIQTAGGAAVIGFFLYMVAFMDTTATIPTGAMAERWKWKAFVGWGLFCGAIFYPLFGAWTWGGGWLAKTWDTMGLGAGYVDFAGSGVVHAMGGVAGLAGALVLGPRIGKYNADKTPNTIPGHHVPMAMLGCFILLFGWFGFNAASTFAATDVQFAVVAANTAIAAAFGATVAMFTMMFKTGKPDPGMMVNGMLAGLVAITAPCAFTSPAWSAVIGGIAGVLVIYAAQFIEKRGVDDPVGAIAVHGVCGIYGVLCVGIFANGSYGGAWNGSDVDVDRRRRQRRVRTARCAGAGCVGAVHRDARPGLRLLQDPERAHEGRHPLGGGRRARRSRPARDGRLRLSRVRRDRRQGSRQWLDPVHRGRARAHPRLIGVILT